MMATVTTVLSWLFLLKITDMGMTASTRERTFFKNTSPAAESNINSVETSSTFVCGSQCLAAFPACTSYLHNASTGLCVQAAGPGPLVSQLESGLGDLYVSCDTENGFHMYRFRSAVACVVAVFSNRRNYTLASSHCTGLGGYLPSVKTWDKLQLLIGVMGNVSFWVGLDDMLEEGKYVWVEDGEVAFQSNATYSSAEMAEIAMNGMWDHPREPNNYADNEDCMQVKYSSTNQAQRLNDYKCHTRSRFACEMKIRFI